MLECWSDGVLGGTVLYDIAIIGAGPIGLACGIEAKKRNLSHIIFDKGCLVNSLYHYPPNMTFFSTAPELEIGDIPFIIGSEKPKRMDALKYYWRVTRHYKLNIQLFTMVKNIKKINNYFIIRTEQKDYETKNVVLAIGYYDNANMLNIPGEDFPHVAHRYSDPHCLIKQKVIVIGANNSAIEAALELFRYNVNVELVHRGSELGKGIKYWVLPDIKNRIKNGEIPVMFNTTVQEITESTILLKHNGTIIKKDADVVLALTGYHPDFDFMKKCGIKIEKVSFMPHFDQKTGETNVANLFIAGALQAGKDANKIFIENGRFHAPVIAKAVVQKMT